jgi:hypothetical protein
MCLVRSYVFEEGATSSVKSRLSLQSVEFFVIECTVLIQSVYC